MTKLMEPETRRPPWAEDEAALLRNLDVGPEAGLDAASARERLGRHGPNALKEGRKTPAWARFLAQFKSPVVVTLLAATVVSALLGELIDAIAIASIVVINAVIGFLQEAKAEAAVEALKRLSSPRARVLRSGAAVSVPAEEVVPGDLLVLEAGDYVAADARVLLASQLSADEALLTGESLPVAKRAGVLVAATPLADRTNMLFAGTAISTGSGRALVTATGMATEIGRIAGMLESAEAVKTPLQSRLEEVGARLLLLCLAVVALVAVLGLLHGDGWLDVAMTAISLAVAAIPEGLPAVVTLALALAVHRMTKRNAIVRHLPAVETLGSTDVICTDKTGTLTTGKMRVRELTGADGTVVEHGPAAADALERVVEAAVLCSNASLGPSGEAVGDPTEAALLLMAQDRGRNPADIQKGHRRLHEWSFESVRKRMSVAVAEEGRVVVHVKGAPESVIPLCRISEEQRKAISAALAALTGKGRRTLAVATRSLSLPPEQFRPEDHASPESVERDLDFLGLIAMADPPRPESVSAIRRCKAAGIKVVMITGDHPVTAKAIASELGLSEPGRFEGVLTGAEMDALDEQAFGARIGDTAVYARVAPEHKLRIVEAWKAKGLVVAMTGDGVNDAPALKAASIGVSMGKGGTEVARQASSMILADDNFATIVAAVEEGRGIYGNIRRTIQYLLSGNLAEILIMLGAALMGWPVPLAPIHLLWINLVTDGLPSLALAAEPVPPDILHTSCKPSARNFFDREFNVEMAFIGVTVAAMALAVYGYSLRAEGELTARTHVFSFLVFAELFRSFASRSETKTFFQLGPLSNAYHLAAVSVPITFQMLLHHTDWFTGLFKVHQLPWSECLPLVALTLVPATVLEVRKWLRHRAAATEAA